MVTLSIEKLVVKPTVFTGVPKKDDCSPAYTIVYNRLSRPIDIDLVPAFLVKGKCPIARSVNPTWIKNDKVVNEIVRQYDIVAKTCPDGKANIPNLNCP